jgi:hypothetical protein
VLPATPIDVEARLRKEEDRAELRARAAEHQLAILRESRLERTRTTMTSEGGR